MIRKAQVAGQFYPAGSAALKKELTRLVNPGEKKTDALGLVSPHAGYVFSGKVAGSCFSRVKVTRTVVILGPNHTGMGAPFSIMTGGTWRMPLGNVEIDAVLGGKILKGSGCIEENAQAHESEHSIEVQLPFLQFFLPEVKIVPIVIGGTDFNAYKEIGAAIAKAIKETGQKVLIVASSDMSHYEPQEKAQEKDKTAIEAILNLDPEELIKRVSGFNITMCGYGPVAIMLCAVKALGAKKAELIKYETSGDASGDYSSVVGYAGILVA
jgi:AmmeMemoRadiSam system protein B